VIARIPATLAARFTIWCFGIYSIIQGAGLIWGGRDRLGASSFTLMRSIPAAPLTWGFWALIAGVTILAASLTASWWARAWWLKLVGLLMLSTWATAFSVSSITGTLASSTGATTGGPTYLLIAFTSAIVIMVDEGRHADA
jgi:hypothetical protein